MYYLSIITNGGGINFEALQVGIQLGCFCGLELSIVTTDSSSDPLIQERAQKLGLKFMRLRRGKEQNKEDFDHQLAIKIKEKLNPDAILFLAGTEKPSSNFLRFFESKRIFFLDQINLNREYDLHKFQDDYQSYLRILCYLDDTKEPLTFCQRKLEYQENDTLASFSQRAVLTERRLIYETLNLSFTQYRYSLTLFQKSGKVRDLYHYYLSADQTEPQIVAFHQTPRLSAFDRSITTIQGRGELLTAITEWWFQKTKDIIPNHYIGSFGDLLFAKPARVIPLEIVVRAYITGNTQTSLWINYQKNRTYCGITFPEDLQKNQELDQIVITPTTKGDSDYPISSEEIIKSRILNLEEWEYISKKALELFRFGQKVADQMGYILVDTKYEFGYDQNDQIMLIDEVHTPDSSRYWIKSTYQQKFNSGEEPDKIDKDAIRDYLKEVMENPYQSPIPVIHTDKKDQVLKGYFDFAQKLLPLNQTFHDFKNTLAKPREPYFRDSVISTNLSYQEVDLLEKYNQMSLQGVKITQHLDHLLSKKPSLLILSEEKWSSYQEHQVVNFFRQKGIPTDYLEIGSDHSQLKTKLKKVQILALPPDNIYLKKYLSREIDNLILDLEPSIQNPIQTLDQVKRVLKMLD